MCLFCTAGGDGQEACGHQEEADGSEQRFAEGESGAVIEQCFVSLSSTHCCSDDLQIETPVLRSSAADHRDGRALHQDPRKGQQDARWALFCLFSSIDLCALVESRTHQGALSVCGSQSVVIHKRKHPSAATHTHATTHAQA